MGTGEFSSSPNIVKSVWHSVWFGWHHMESINTLRPRQNGRHFPINIFKWIFLNENVWISINISLKFVPKGPINNIPILVQVMAWRRPGDKPLSEPMMDRLPTHICVTQPQWVKEAALPIDGPDTIPKLPWWRWCQIKFKIKYGPMRTVTIQSSL